MTSLRPFHALDLFTFSPVNLDVLTETYDITYYLSYLCRWPTLCMTLESPQKLTTGYRTSPPASPLSRPTAVNLPLPQSSPKPKAPRTTSTAT